MAQFSLDEENRQEYRQKQKYWKNVRFKTGEKDSREYVQSKRPLADFKALPKEKVVNVLRKDSEDWIHSLTEKEKHAIAKYTYNSGDKKPNRFFERLNEMLRGDGEKEEKLQEYADTISNALKKNVLKHDIVCYRGMNIDPSHGIPINGLFKVKQFWSTSVVERNSFDSGFNIVMYVKKGTTGAYIENLSHFKKQREFLLDKDCIYKVLSREDNLIELEVIR